MGHSVDTRGMRRSSLWSSPVAHAKPQQQRKERWWQVGKTDSSPRDAKDGNRWTVKALFRRSGRQNGDTGGCTCKPGSSDRPSSRPLPSFVTNYSNTHPTSMQPIRTVRQSLSQGQ
nr:hypothetical protein CFP56_16764 [Quercus suber]